MLKIENMFLTPWLVQMDLPEDYATVIQLWREAWGRLRAHTVISEPNKIHIINCHLEVTHNYRVKLKNLTPKFQY